MLKDFLNTRTRNDSKAKFNWTIVLTEIEFKMEYKVKNFKTRILNLLICHPLSYVNESTDITTNSTANYYGIKKHLFM